MREVHAETLAALHAPGANVVTIVDLRWPGGILRRTDAGYLVGVLDKKNPLSNRNYEPTRELVDLGQIAETAEPRANTLTITLDAVSPAMVGALLSQPITSFTFDLCLAVVDEVRDQVIHDVVGEPILLLSGAGSGWSLRAASPPTIDLEVSSHWAAWRVVRGRLTGRESQQAHFPGDRGFDQAGLETGDLKWGSA